MPQMTYFRRPQLAGRALKRTTNATVRGNIRRSDPDAVSSSPYFPNVAAGQQVTVKTQGGTHTATLTSSNFLQVLADLNLALGNHGLAFDVDGCIGIQSRAVGAAGWVEIVGGTGAARIGFDVTIQRFRAVGGDLPSMPEGRFGHQFGSAFPGPGLSFETYHFSNALARVSGNVDVLFSDLMKQEAVLQKLGTVTGTGQTSIDIESVSAGARVFTGAGQTPVLTSSSTKEEIARYFLLIDTVTKRVSQCRVTGVTTALGVNILGTEQERLSSANITSIKNGRVVECVGVDFNAAGVVPGDFALIAGATNTNQWSNNGYRWVVEEILATTKIALRPMSAAELALVGTTVSDEQPVLELNGDGTSSQSMGQLTVRSGPWAKNARLSVSPALPAGAVVEVWAAVPRDSRSGSSHEEQISRALLTNELVSDLNPLPNAVLTPPTLQIVGTGGGNQVQVGAFYARWHGRPVYLPAQNINVAAYAGNEAYCVWDEADCAVKVEASRTGFGAGAKQLLCVIPSTQSGVRTVRRVAAESSRAVTVGAGGQVATLDEAIELVNQLALAHSETNASTGAFSHFEIIVVSDVTAANTAITAPGVVVRGATSAVKISGSDSLATVASSSRVTFRDLYIVSPAAVPAFRATAACDFIFENVNTGSGSSQYLVSGNPRSVVAKNCNFSLASGFVYSSAATTVSVDGSTLSQLGTGTQQVLSGPGNKWLGKRIVFRDCVFSNWVAGAYPLLWDDDLADCVSLVDDCDFSSVSGASLVDSAGKARFTNNLVGRTDGYLRRVTSFSSPDSYVDGCVLYVYPQNVSDSAVTSGRVTNNNFVVSAGSGGSVATASRAITGNSIFGNPTTDFVRASDGMVVAGNWKASDGANVDASQTPLSTIGLSLSYDASSAYLRALGTRNLALLSAAGPVDIGTLNQDTTIKGRLKSAQGITGASVDVGTGYVQAGTPNNAGARLDTVGGQGRLVLGKSGLTDIVLDRDKLAVLVGGNNADELHTHTFTDTTGPSSASQISAVAGGSRTSNTVQGQLENLDSAKSGVDHLHTIGQVSNLQAALDGKAPSSHGHTIADVATLQADLDNRSVVGHEHLQTSIVNLATDLQTLRNTDAINLSAAKLYADTMPMGRYDWTSYSWGNEGNPQLLWGTNQLDTWVNHINIYVGRVPGGWYGEQRAFDVRLYALYRAGQNTGLTAWEFLIDGNVFAWNHVLSLGNYTFNALVEEPGHPGYSAEGAAGGFLHFNPVVLAPGPHTFTLRQKLIVTAEYPRTHATKYMDTYWSKIEVY